MLNHAIPRGIYQNLKSTGFKKIITLIFIALLVLTLGCVSIPEKQSTPTPTTTPILTTTPVPTLPPFQPSIWDKAVVEPAGSELSPPFMFDIDISSSYGFERKYLEYETFGKPIFVLSRGKTASIVLLINSSSNRTIQVSLKDIDGLTEGTTARLKPESYALQPNEQAKLELNVTASLTAPISTPKPESAPKEFVALRLKGDGWGIGRAFILKINQSASEQCIPLPYAAYDQSPEMDAKDVPIIANISITFSRPPLIVKLEAEPKIEISNITREIVGIASGRFTFYPAVPLKPETNYTITIIYGQEEAPEGYCRTSSTSWRFTTGSMK